MISREQSLAFIRSIYGYDTQGINSPLAVMSLAGITGHTRQLNIVDFSPFGANREDALLVAKALQEIGDQLETFLLSQNVVQVGTPNE